MNRIYLAVLVLALSSFISTANLNNDAIKNSSTQFKMSRNSNRIALFESLHATLKVKPRNLHTQGAYSSYNDVIELFGEPNIKINNYIVVYTLNPMNGCKAVLEFDSMNALVYVGIKECN